MPGALADPVLELHGPPGFVTIINDNCSDIRPAALPSSFASRVSLDSAIDGDLGPGSLYRDRARQE